MSPRSVSLPSSYGELLRDLKGRIRAARFRASQAVTSELVLLYWEIGREILTRQTTEGWGTKVIDRLSEDLRSAFPGTKGFSPRNLRNMRDLAREFPYGEIWQQLLPKCPWGHLMVLLHRLKSPEEREWYLRATIQNGWSRAVLEAQIETGLKRRLGAAPNNFHRTLPSPQSELAQQTIKDPYNFDFLALAEDVREHELERALIGHLADFLVELGHGFAYLGRQVHLEVGNQDYYIDLLFYHVKLHCYVVIDLKMGEFKPEYAGKLNFYLSATDDQLRDADVDNPTLGILLCKSKQNVVVEYALRKMGQPIGVSEMELARSLPDELLGKLPTIEQLETELEDVESEAD